MRVVLSDGVVTVLVELSCQINFIMKPPLRSFHLCYEGKNVVDVINRKHIRLDVILSLINKMTTGYQAIGHITYGVFVQSTWIVDAISEFSSYY